MNNKIKISSIEKGIYNTSIVNRYGKGRYISCIGLIEILFENKFLGNDYELVTIHRVYDRFKDAIKSLKVLGPMYFVNTFKISEWKTYCCDDVANCFMDLILDIEKETLQVLKNLNENIEL